MDEHVIVDFNKIQGPVYTGRARGEALRAQYQLDLVDDQSAQVDVIIPESTYTVSSSFFLGLFGPSVVKAGSVELFKQRFHFRAPEFMASIIDDHAAKALQGRTLLSH